MTSPLTFALGMGFALPLILVGVPIRLALVLKERPGDPFRWAQLMEQWATAGLPVLEYATSSPSRMVPAWAKFYVAVIGDGLTHDGDPRLVRHVGNMALKTDRLGPRPVKEHRGSPRLIDLAICAVGAYDRATYHAAQPATTFRSNYETEGLTFTRGWG